MQIESYEFSQMRKAVLEVHFSHLFSPDFGAVYEGKILDI